MTKEEFRNVCKLAWEKPYGFVVVDLTSNKDNGKYRIGFDTFYIPNLKKVSLLYKNGTRTSRTDST